MSDKTKRVLRINLIAGFLFVLLFAHIPVFYTLFYNELTGAPKANASVIQIDNFTKDNRVILNGEWELYFDRLLVTAPGQSGQPDALASVPGYWSDYTADGKDIPAAGCGSYRLRLEGLPKSVSITVYIPNFGGAYRVFIDGELAAKSGVLSTETKEINTVPLADLYPVTLSNGQTHEIIIEMATTRFSGLYMAPVLSDYEAAISHQKTQSNIRFLLFDIVLVSFFILILLSVLSRGKKLSAVWLPGLMLCVLLRLMLSSEFFAVWQNTIFGGLSYEDSNPLLYLVTFVLKMLLIYLIQDQFCIVFSRKEKLFFTFYYGAIFLVYLFVPQSFYNIHLSLAVPIASFALEIYAFFKLLLGRPQFTQFGLFVYWGIIIALAGLTVDCYYLGGYVYPDMSLALLIMLTVCLISISFAYTFRLASIYRDLAVAKSMFNHAKKQIIIQKEYYDSLSCQINEVRAVRHDMHHFINVMNVLVKENRIEELKRFLNSYSEKTDTSPLPVFCQNSVVNSILGYYYLQAGTEKIAFRCECSISATILVDDMDLCVVLGNALENALEACKKIEEADRFISIHIQVLSGQLLIKVENSYQGDVKLQDDKLLSSKTKGIHGIGLQSIKNIAERYGGYIKATYENNLFTVMVAFPYSKSQ